MFLKAKSRQLLSSLRTFLNKPLFEKEYTVRPSPVEQVSLSLRYRELKHGDMPAQEFRDVGFRIYSQFEEDGILLYIFSIIGTTNKKCIEICLGNPLESNTANLILNHRWVGLLFEGDPGLVSKANKFYKESADTWVWPPTIVESWITKDNIDHLITRHGFKGEIDLLSIDIDGIDYWLWKSIISVQPRVVIVEYNHLWGPEKSVTVPYDEHFKAVYSGDGSDYAGASLMAFIKLAKEKGYHYIGSNEISTNAFFLRDDLANKWLPERDPKDFFRHPRAEFGMTVRWERIKDKEWIEI